MILREWLLATKIKVYQFAQLIGYDRCYIFSVMKGTYIPSDELMEKVRTVTFGKITKKEEMIGLKHKHPKD